MIKTLLFFAAAVFFMSAGVTAKSPVIGAQGSIQMTSETQKGLSMPDFNPRDYICYRTAGELNIDGKDDEGSWQKAPWTFPFIDIRGESFPDPKHQTRVKMLWDDEFFYVFAQMEEPDIWGTITERDEVVFYDDDFEVFIDPDGDTHGYYELEVNALNTVWDLLLVKPYMAGGPAINNWDINGLKTAVHIDGTLNDPKDTDQGWNVEIAFPVSALMEFARNKKPAAGVQWRINFSRVDWHMQIADGMYKKATDPDSNKPLPEENWVWSPQGVVNMHRPETWGFVQFSDIEVGAGEDPFEYHSYEDVKWELRIIYYAQRAYRSYYGKFADSVDQLEAAGLIINEFKFQPEMHTGWSTFEVRAKGSSQIWYINQEGRTWSEKF